MQVHTWMRDHTSGGFSWLFTEGYHSDSVQDNNGYSIDFVRWFYLDCRQEESKKGLACQSQWELYRHEHILLTVIFIMYSVRFNITGFVNVVLYSAGINIVSFALDTVAVTVCHYRQEPYHPGLLIYLTVTSSIIYNI